jgi:hypothetical protein
LDIDLIVLGRAPTEHRLHIGPYATFLDEIVLQATCQHQAAAQQEQAIVYPLFHILILCLLFVVDLFHFWGVEKRSLLFFAVTIGQSDGIN